MTDRHHPEPDVARGADTIVDVLAEAEAAGYSAHLIARETGKVECSSCSQLVEPSSLDVEHVRRLEGASDAADEVLVAWAVCPVCGAGGTLTVGYGPNASAADAAVLPDLQLEGAERNPPLTRS